MDGESIIVSLDVDANDKDTWDEALETLRALLGKQEYWDSLFRAFAGDRLTDLANDWRQDGDSEITKDNFIRRIEISSLAAYPDGRFTSYYDDDDIFFGHVIMIEGDIVGGLESATIAG